MPSLLPPDHPLRNALAAEVHARPPEAVETPSRASYIAVLVDDAERAREIAHVCRLCELHGVPPPDDGLIQFSVLLGAAVRFKWERHGEFSSYTVVAPGNGQPPFAEPAATLLAPGWLAGLPGRAIVAAHAELVPEVGGPPDAAALAAIFGGHLVVGAAVGGGAGSAYTDFRIQSDGFGRFLLCDRTFTPRQAGRMLQRLFEIESYRMLALLALPVARRLSPRAMQIERELSALAGHIAGGADGERDDDRPGHPTPAVDERDDEALLQALTHLAAELERELTASQFRFGACRAYHALVTTRIAELREERLPAVQTIDEFMARRLAPAVDTCNTVSRRLHDLAERVAHTSALLSTRVDIKRERQNQALLASMDRRAKLQLRLQQTVEGLSLAAIVYYVVGLVGYAAKAGRAAGWPLDPDLLVGAAIPVVALAGVWTLRRARRGLRRGDAHGVERAMEL